MNEDISIYMLSYNHKEFIAKAIESIMSQKTQYSYKLYIHDDSSTDGTIEIIKQYVEKYPDRIVPVFEKSNLYSTQGLTVINRVMYPYFNGKYIAFCEGDDYWIDNNKLEMQINYMKNHPDCSYCFTDAIHVDINNSYLGAFYKHYYWKDRSIVKKLKCDSDFNTEEVLRIDFTPTASGIVTKSAFEYYLTFKYPIDLGLRLTTTEFGYAHYFNKKTTAYRVGNSSSASGQASQSFKKYLNDFYFYHKEILNEFNNFTNFKYKNTIDQVIDRKLVLVYIRFLSKKNYKEFIHLKAYKELTGYRKIRYFLKRSFKQLIVNISFKEKMEERGNEKRK